MTRDSSPIISASDRRDVTDGQYARNANYERLRKMDPGRSSRTELLCMRGGSRVSAVDLVPRSRQRS